MARGQRQGTLPRARPAAAVAASSSACYGDAMNKPLLIVLSVITLDSAGIGLIFPILPSLLRELTGTDEVSVAYGVMLALYAFMQFVFSPALGALSDRYGRRPVLLVSIAGAAIDYLVMAASPFYWLLLVGRAIAGITGANMAVATAYVSDITADDQRARRFGYVSACFGLGFILGPALGGLLGGWWLRAPFIAAALLNAANLVLVYMFLPESRRADGGRIDLAALNPFAPLRWAMSLASLLPLVLIFALYALIGNIPGTIWVLYGQDRFQWDTFTVGLSLAVFGLSHAVAQAFVTGPLAARFGEVRTIVIGIAFDSLAFLTIAFATRGWIAFALAPLFALGGVGLPALQSLMANQVSNDRQGALQGVLASANGLTAILGPLVGTEIYALTREVLPGAVWMLGVVMYALTVPLLLGRPSSRPPRPREERG
jgi:DHA1 family tetracycline resistance protein-like MFS transporter